MVTETKLCEKCGRTFSWRKKWEKNWDAVKFCSHACKKLKFKRPWKALIMNLLEVRGNQKTICPSEVLELKDKKNKDLLEEIRMNARLLANEEKIHIMQGGKILSPQSFKGPIRLKIRND